MPSLTYSVSDFVAFTKIRAADVNSRFTDIKTLLNTTKLDDDNIQAAGITRATKLKTGTAWAIVSNNTTGAMSEISPAASTKAVLQSGGASATAVYASPVFSSEGVSNLGLSVSVASNAMTIALKTAGGSDPSSTDPVQISMRSSTATTGTYNVRSATAATSLVVSSGSTLGTVSGKAEKLWVYLLDNSGTLELAISRRLYDTGSVVSTTAEGGAGAADSAAVMYSTTARTDVPCRLIGRISITEATAGTWATAATEVALQPFSTLQGIYARVKGTDGVNIPNITFTVIGYANVDFDPYGIISGTSSTSFRATAPIAGKYRVTCKARLAAFSSWGVGDIFSLAIYKNGSQYNEAFWNAYVSGGSNIAGNQLNSDIIDLAAGDYVDARLYQSTGARACETGNTSCYFCIERIGD